MIRSCFTYFFRNIYSFKLFKHHRMLNRKSILAFDDNFDYQFKKLVKVLEIAINNMPYYKNINIDLNNLTYDEFSKLPFLTKSVIRDSSRQLINNNYPSKKKLYKNSSGGSTGEPVVFYQTDEKGISGAANYYYSLSLNEVNFYDKTVDLWGAERDMYKGKSKFSLRNFILNKTVLNTFVLSDEIIINYISRLNTIKPHYIKAYVHSIYEIAKYINSNKIEINFIPIIHCTTGPLYPEMRAEIRKAFNNCHVFNFYGSREVSAIATEIKGGQGMFILFDNVFVEILDENGQPVKKGEEGEVVVTTLNNDYMPLIRYKIGDRAIKGDDLKFGTLHIDKVIGRTLGVIYRKDGIRIDGQFFTTLFFNKKSIKSFQLVQNDINSLDLNIVKNHPFDLGELNTIIDRIYKELGDVNININYVDKINLTSTGKIMYVYSKISNT